MLAALMRRPSPVAVLAIRATNAPVSWLCYAGLATLFAGLNTIAWQAFTGASAQHSLGPAGLWLMANLGLLACYMLARVHYLRPLAELRRVIRQTTGNLSPLTCGQAASGEVMGEMLALAALVREQSHYQRELACALDDARHIIARCNQQQQAVLRSASREAVLQYQAVLGYAHYLDEQIQQRRFDAQLRYDYDDVCESGFTLKLVAGALDLLRQDYQPTLRPLAVGSLLQQTLLALAPSLDRRAMAITTAEVDETLIALSDTRLLTHLVWMMLLGLIRYAASESTLALACAPSPCGGRVLLRITISELAPCRMSEEERAAYLIRQLQHGSPHMFAETLRIQGNLQLAELLLGPISATLEVRPISSYQCDICLSLPLAEI